MFLKLNNYILGRSAFFKYYLLTLIAFFTFEATKAQGPSQVLSQPKGSGAMSMAGSASNNINLNTGEINIPVTLATIPGRNGLGASVSASYNSAGVRDKVDVRNLQASTGVLGLGWSIGLDKISCDHKGTGSRLDDEFYINGNKLLKTGGDATTWTYSTFSQMFWKVTYYHMADYWEVIKEDGTKYFYGQNEDAKQTIIKWGNWIGQSREPTNRQVMSVSWCLNRRENIYGDQVNYTYDKVTERVQGSTQLYTKATYLKSIEGNLGHKIVLAYLEKDSNEYADPHTERAEDTTNPDAYQEMYGTRYLKSVAVIDQSHLVSHVDHVGTIIDAKSSVIEYPTLAQGSCPITETNGIISSDCRISHQVTFEYTAVNDGADNEKRLLSKIKRYNDKGQISSPTSFAYTLSAAHKGILFSQTSPAGAITSYEFSTIAIPNSDREITVNAPSGYDDPRIWHADNYSVITWYNDVSDKVWLQCYYWTGKWVKVIDQEITQYSGATIPRTNGEQSFDVEVRDDFFAIFFTTSKDIGKIAIGYKLENSVNQWALHEEGIYLGNGVNADLVVGEKFVAVSVENRSLYRYVRTSDDWIYSYVNRGLGEYKAAAYQSTLVTHNNSDGKIYSYFLDQDNNWNTSSVINSGIQGFSNIEIKTSGSSFIIQSEETVTNNSIKYNPHPVLRQEFNYEFQMIEYCIANPTKCSEGTWNNIGVMKAGGGWEELKLHMAYTNDAQNFIDNNCNPPCPATWNTQYSPYTNRWSDVCKGVGNYIVDWSDSYEPCFVPWSYNLDNDLNYNWTTGASSYQCGQWTNVIDERFFTRQAKLYEVVWDYDNGVRYHYDVYNLSETGFLAANSMNSFDNEVPNAHLDENYVLTNHDQMITADPEEVLHYKYSPDGGGTWKSSSMNRFDGNLNDVAMGSDRYIYGDVDDENRFYVKTWDANTEWWNSTRYDAWSYSRIGNDMLSLNNQIYFFEPDGALSAANVLTSNAGYYSSGNEIRHGANFTAYRSYLDTTDPVLIYNSRYSAVQFYKSGAFLNGPIELGFRRSFSQEFEENNDISNLVGNFSIASYYEVVLENLNFRLQKLDEVSSIKLHRAVNENISGTQTAYAVTKVTHNDGHAIDGVDAVYVAIEYRDGQMMPNGQSARFGNTSIMPGTYSNITSVPSSSGGVITFGGSTDVAYRQAGLPLGFTTFFFNQDGVAATEGLVTSKFEYDADMNAVTRVSTTYDVITENLGAGIGNSYYIRPTYRISSLDGLITETTTTYNDFGLTSTVATTNNDHNNIEQTLTTHIIYANEGQNREGEADKLTNRNILTFPLGQFTEDGTNIISRQYASHYNLYGEGTPVSEGLRIQSEITPYVASSTPYRELEGSGTITTQEIYARDAFGNVTEARGLDGVFSTTVYGFNASVPLATFVNARSNEVFYEDFEDGSALDGWPGMLDIEPEQTTNGTMILDGGSADQVVPDITYVGNTIVEYNLRFEDGAGISSVSLVSSNTIKADVNANGQITLQRVGGSLDTKTLSIDPFEWNHIRIVKEGGDIKLYVNGTKELGLTESSGNGHVLFQGFSADIEYDNIRIYPADASCTSKSIDPTTKLEKNATAPSGLTGKALFNDRNQVVATIDGYGKPIGTHASSFRLTNVYNSATPDLSTSTSILGENAFYDDFEINKDWIEYDAGQGTNWTSALGQLISAAPGGGSGNPDAFYYDLGEEYQGSVSVEFDVRSSSSLSSWNFGFAAGGSDFDGRSPGSSENAIWAAFNGTNWQTYHGSVWHTISSAPEINLRSYRIKIVIDLDQDRADYYIDGRIFLKDQPLRQPTSGIQKITFLNYGSTAADWMIDNLLVYEEGIQSTSWVDAHGKTIQSQEETGDDKRMISQTFYDHAGRPHLSTKPVETTGKLEFISNFAIYNSSTGAMSGLAATLNSDCGNYPYAEVKYEHSPLSRQKEIGQYGSTFNLASGHTATSDSYMLSNASATVKGLFPGYTESRYYVRESENQDGHTSYVLNDKLGRVIMTASQTGASTYVKTGYEYDAQGNVIKIKPPNYYNPPHGSANDFVSTMQYDGLGQLVYEDRPDTGVRRYYYDVLGRLRFMQDAQAASDGMVLYWIYDELGRLTQNGNYSSAWDEETFASLLSDSELTFANGTFTGTYDVKSKNIYFGNSAGDPTTFESGSNMTAKADYVIIKPGTWIKPGAVFSVKNLTNPLIWKRKFEYSEHADHTINNYSLESVSGHESNGAEVIEEYEYNDRGNLVNKKQKTTGFDDNFYDIGYTYDALGRTVSVDYGDGLEVGYTYDALGRIQAIGIPGDQDLFATYSYDDHGQLANALLNNGSIAVGYTYNELGWLTGINSNPYSESIDYTSNAYGSPSGYYTGKISRISHSYAGSLLIPDHTMSYSYDGLNRMTNENSSINGAFNVQYDANGNITSRKMPTQGNQVNTYNYYPGTNRIKNWDGAGDDYTYDANGNTVGNTKKGLSFTYDTFTNLTSSYTSVVSGEFHYGASDQRVLKTSNSEKILYVHGQNDYPLVEYHEEPDGSIIKYAYIYGSNGLVASKQGAEGWKYLIKDHLGSVRVVMNSSNVAEEGHGYTAYGSELITPSTENISYQYTGQERDPELDLFNYRARLYDEETATFYATDPAGQFHSPYSYVGGNPVNMVDPTGEWGWLLAGVVNYLWSVGESHFEQGLSWSDSFSFDNSPLTFSGNIEANWGYQSGSYYAPGSYSGALDYQDAHSPISGFYGFTDAAIYNRHVSAGTRLPVHEVVAQNGYFTDYYSQNFTGVYSHSYEYDIFDFIYFREIVSPRATGAIEPVNIEFEIALLITTSGIGNAATKSAQLTSKVATNLIDDGIRVFADDALLLASNTAKKGLTNNQLVTKSATLAEKAVGGTGRFAGTAKHTYATNLLRRYQGIYGNRGLRTNVYFNGRNGRGFLDVLDETNGIIYDWKFGRPFMSNSQFTKYSRHWRLPVNIVDRAGNVIPR
ncbi:MAG: RHS repeat-associated core domain-containing protein [Reichenbachiella sp.]|uniref:RHS repeat-associated core domain-containing protein n=1 Tax=Reichenbachiella sp. TaxID=2184521 RepID=UPI0032645D75